MNKLPTIQQWITLPDVKYCESFNPILHESETGFQEKYQETPSACKCGEDRPEMFYKTKDKRRGGLVYRLQPCKECYKKKNRTRYIKNKP